MHNTRNVINRTKKVCMYTHTCTHEELSGSIRGGYSFEFKISIDKTDKTVPQPVCPACSVSVPPSRFKVSLFIPVGRFALLKNYCI